MCGFRVYPVRGPDAPQKDHLRICQLFQRRLHFRHIAEFIHSAARLRSSPGVWAPRNNNVVITPLPLRSVSDRQILNYKNVLIFGDPITKTAHCA